MNLLKGQYEDYNNLMLKENQIAQNELFDMTKNKISNMKIPRIQRERPQKIFDYVQQEEFMDQV